MNSTQTTFVYILFGSVCLMVSGVVEP